MIKLTVTARRSRKPTCSGCLCRKLVEGSHTKMQRRCLDLSHFDSVNRSILHGCELGSMFDDPCYAMRVLLKMAKHEAFTMGNCPPGVWEKRNKTSKNSDCGDICSLRHSVECWLLWALKV